MYANKNALARGLKLACSQVAYKKGRDQLVPLT